MSLWNLFERSVRLHGSKTALVFHDVRVSYEQLAAMSSKMADRILTEVGEARQQKIFILSRNSIEMIALILGCFKANQIACPMNWRLSPKELAVLMQEHEYGIRISDRESENLLRTAEKITGSRKNDGGGFFYLLEELCAAETETHEEVEGSLEDGAIQLFTSGSTGTPKAACHTTGGLMFYIYSYAVESKWTAEDIYQTSANLFHMSGLSILISLMIGCTTVIFDRFEIMDFLKVLEREKSTRVSLIPTLVARLLHEDRFRLFDFTSVKKIICGGAPINYTMAVQAMERFQCQLEQAYGMTESCCMTMLRPEDYQNCVLGKADKKILTSVGRPLPMVQIRIRQDAEYMDNGKVCGEIEVKSPFLCMSLFPAAGSMTEDGYHLTGDVGYMEEDGFLYLVGRKHDMIICGGENIYPREVEDCISTLENDVNQVCVLGMPDKFWGEIVVACIVKKNGSALTEDEVIAYCKQHIASYKKPKKVVFCDSLPENSNGKISRILLKEHLEELFNQKNTP